MDELTALREANTPLWVGLDVHKGTCTAVALTDMGEKKATWTFETTRAKLREFAEGLPRGTPVGLEASTTGKAVFCVLRDAGVAVRMGHPTELAKRMPKGRKTDEKDALTLGNCLRMNDFPEAYVPPPEFEAIRNLVRFRIRLGEQTTAVKDRVHAIVARNLQNEVMDQHSDYFGVGGLESLTNLPLVDQDRAFLNAELAQLAGIAEQEEWAEREMARLAQGRKEVELLMTIPGVGYYTALGLYGEIANIARFPDKKRFASYCGVTPQTDNSGERVSEHRRVRRGNPVLKRLLCTAVRGAVRARKKNAVARFYAKKVKHMPGSKAEVAAARKLSAIVYTILTTGQPYVEQDPKLVERKTEKLEQKAKAPVAPVTIETLRATVARLQAKGEVLERLGELVEDPDPSEQEGPS